MKNRILIIVLASIVFLFAGSSLPRAFSAEGKSAAASAGRERLLMDFGWRFAFGHPFDTDKDFTNGTSYFSYFTKAGYGDGPASANFDDRAWRVLDVPHDWAVEAPFDSRGSHSHGYKAVGRQFPETSVGWYRKSFEIPASDLGRRISIEFDGVFRDSIVWVNGHYLGREPSGYSGFRYDITDYLNYGGRNLVAVRVDATMEEGWFYEGAGIYRHVRLVKTAPLHVAPYGTYVVSEVQDDAATVTVRTTVMNEGTAQAAFAVEQTVLDAEGLPIASGQIDGLTLTAGETNGYPCSIDVARPMLWSLESPYLYRLVTTIRNEGQVVDRYETPFGIRTIRFDSNEGFFLNGKRVELKGTNNHQDHACVGVAIPDALQEFRILRLKSMGSNAYRCSHNPPAPELLDACDRLGMLVIDENRLMGTTPEIMGQLERMILRDRNHPSVILWSMGNEEWAIEGNITGARIASTMEAFTKRLDPTRRVTVAISGGWGGISTVIDVAGVNYIKQGDTDKQHREFPNQPIVGTEESTTRQTRGVYVDDKSKGYLAPLQDASTGGNIEIGWKHYAARPYLAGVFYWTGFDYRGEPNPFGWPQVSSHAGILDLCGFPKDSFYYLTSWWTDVPVVHLFPHWNWSGKEGQEIDVWCYSNCDEVELFLNDKSLGKKTMEKNAHLEWAVKYKPGTLVARGYKDGKEAVVHRIETTGAPAAVRVIPDRSILKADGEDVSVITVQVCDEQGRIVPTAGNDITFKLEGPGDIIGVGNGDPSSHEPDRYVEKVSSLPISNWRHRAAEAADALSEVAFDLDDSNWPEAFKRNGNRDKTDKSESAPANVYRGVFDLTANTGDVDVMLLLRSFGETQSIYVNGTVVAENLRHDDAGFELKLAPGVLRPGKNVVAIVATSFEDGRSRGRPDAGNPGIVRVTTPAGDWKRSVFNGLAQVIVQSAKETGTITLKVTSEGLTAAELKLVSQSVPLRPAVPVK